MGQLETSIYIIGSKKNWQLNSNHLKSIFLLIGLIFVIMACFSTYQYFAYNAKIQEVQQLNYDEKQKSEKLQESLSQLESHYDTELQKLKAMIAEKQPLNSESQSKENVFVAKITEVQEQLQKKEGFIKELQTQKTLYLQQIESLKKQLMQYQQQEDSEGPSLQTPQASVSAINIGTKDAFEVKIDQFQFEIDPEKTKMAIQLHLYNLTDDIQSGYIRVLLVNQTQLKMDIPFKETEATSYSIRRFKRFFKEYTYSPKYKAVRVTVWNRNHDLILDQYYPLESVQNAQ
ncbi:MAG: hypothetical protein HQM11_07140 [SAR324 cluster bacterium]|nr:hypothetical protein [SAR324 cluster bacterium]